MRMWISERCKIVLRPCTSVSWKFVRCAHADIFSLRHVNFCPKFSVLRQCEKNIYIYNEECRNDACKAAVTCLQRLAALTVIQRSQDFPFYHVSAWVIRKRTEKKSAASVLMLTLCTYYTYYKYVLKWFLLHRTPATGGTPVVAVSGSWVFCKPERNLCATILYVPVVSGSFRLF